MGSNPYTRLSLLGFAHPVVRPPFQVQEKTTLLRGREYEEGRVMALRIIFVKYIRINLVLIYFGMLRCKRVVYQTLVKYYKKLVNCKKILHKWVSIYEICECDIGALDIYRFQRVDGLSTGPPG